MMRTVRMARGLSRRDALRLATGASAAALLAACGSSATTAVNPTAGGSGQTVAPANATGGTGATSAANATGAPGSSGAVSSTAGSAASGGMPMGQAGDIVIPTPQVKLPTEPVSFRWIDSGDLKALFYKPYFAAYQKAHPNITVTYDALGWPEINRIVPLGIQNGDAHDCFAIPQNLTGAQAVAQGWVAPLDDLVPNFAQWKQNFPFGSFINGIHVFNGKTYTFPVTSNRRYGTMTLYNTDYLSQAGYDPGAKPFTWDEFRAAAKKLTQQGKGQYYGLLIAGKGNYLDGWVSNLARMAGASANTGANANTDNISPKTGEYMFAADPYIAAVELLLAMKADGSIFPGSLTLSSNDARAKMPQGTAAMILEGPWNIPQWPRENPNFHFGVASQPIPNSGNPLPLTYEETGANQEWVYAKSKYKAIAGDMFAYVGSLAGQTAIEVASQGNLLAMLPQANMLAQQTQKLDPHASQALALFARQVQLGPMAVVRNPDVAQVYLELHTVTPTLNDTIVGLYSGQLSDPKKAMQDLKDRSEKELDRAIKAVQAKGAKVSRDDWVFPNWDPTRDYTEADYAAVTK